MNNPNKSAFYYLITLSLINLSLCTGRVAAQNNSVIANESNIPLDDQVRFLGELESRNSSEWNFTTKKGKLTEYSYQLEIPQSDVRLVERNQSIWRNTGTEYSILVDVYQENSRESEQ